MFLRHPKYVVHSGIHTLYISADVNITYIHTHVLYVLMYKLCKNFSIFIGVITILSLKISDTKNCNFKLF